MNYVFDMYSLMQCSGNRSDITIYMKFFTLLIFESGSIREFKVAIRYSINVQILTRNTH